MIFCDLSVNNTPVWVGSPCETAVPLDPNGYYPFVGSLMFFDTQPDPITGFANPEYQGLGSRFVLVYFQDGEDNVTLPLQAIPAQSIDVVLGNQNCTISFYEAVADQQQLLLTPNPHYVEPGYWDDYSE